MVALASLALFYPTLLTTLMQANYTIFPDDAGVPYLIKLDYQPLTPLENSNLASDVNSITFTLYTRQNPTNGQSLRINDANSVIASRWNANRPTIVVAHGWKSAGTKPACTLVRDAFLKALDSNVIIVDWSQIAKNLNYATVAKSVPTVANHVASFVNFLQSKCSLKPSTLKMIGHSLGAHAVSLAARTVSKPSQVSEVVALDPAKPMFEGNGPNDRVDRTHARNVQVVHTCAGFLGMNSAVGTSDFYANGGKNQPGCSNDLLGACSHGRSYEFFSESVENRKGFLGTPQKGGATAYMGGPTLDPKAHGSYDFKTGSSPPYTVAH
ncbi:pancreatic triacylglycerol lipase [Lasioglossum baleicum]|uniref:pancreatic triacylglycerol lipase n=1 Tax=Lasioglossum baleicum TaxID=434251 RepID=UPI003FCD2E0C